MIDLAAFVPRLAAELATDERSTYTQVEGSMLSADISGFTALSEKLAGKGKAGAEEITELINTCFTALIDAAYGYDGEIIKFGGDALLVLFRGDGHARRCANAALAMQIALHDSPTAKRAQLDMTIGASHGPFDVFLAGSDYRDLLVIGPAATQVIHLEGEADKGETLVSDEIAASLPVEVLGRRHAGGVAIGGAPIDPPSAPAPRTVGIDQLDAFVPQRVREQFEAFSELGGEHRLVAVGFVMVGGVSAAFDEIGRDGTAAALGSLVDDIVAASSSFGVTALHTDIAVDGFKFVLCAGAPVNPGDISDALLNAALAISTIDSRFTLRQGAQTGRVFAGFLGAPHRRTYTLMGDPVNTAARMLGKAADREIVAVATMVDDTRAVFETDAIEPFHVKGKTEPIEAYHVRGVSDEVRRQGTATRLFGRTAELETITRAIGELGEIVVLTGPAGVGKSRLLDAAWDQSEGLTIFQGACTPYGVASPYSVFRSILRSGSDLELTDDPARVGRTLATRVERAAPQLLPMLPLLAIPFGAEVPATAESDAIEPQFRRARIHDAVVEFLDAILQGPVLLVIEDLHWVDDASGELVNHLMRAADKRPWAGVFTRRPEGSWSFPDALAHVTELAVNPLSADDIRSLASAVAHRALSNDELAIIIDRSGGNPLFAVELARAVGSGSADGLPDSIEGLISTRIDGLPPRLRQAVRLASVFGREFDPGDLAAVSSDGVRVDEQLQALDGIVQPGKDHQFVFVHAMYRDVAYEGLPFRQRRRLHGAVGGYLEASSRDHLSLAGLLSLHFSEARNHPKAWAYSCAAGDAARHSFANSEAAAFYRRALASSRFVRDVSKAERAEIWEKLGVALELNGQYDEAFTAYQNQKACSDDLDARVRATRRQARARQRLKNLTAATRLLHQAESMLRGVRREPWVHRRLAEIHLNLSGIRMDQGRLYDARTAGELAEYHATKAGDDALVVQAYGAIVGGLTHWDEAQDFLDSVEMAASIGAFEAESMLAQNLGMIAFFAGEWQQAVRLYERGGAAAAKIGNVTIATAAEMNAAEILVDQGHFAAAETILTTAVRVFDAASYESARLYAELNLGTALMRRGGDDLDDGIVMLERCAREFHAGSFELYAIEADLRLAEGALHRDDPADAMRRLEPILDTATTIDRGMVIEARGLRLLGIAALRQNDPDRALDSFSRAESICRTHELRFELALTLLGLHNAGDEAKISEADGILRDLGVVSTPFHDWRP